jgi:ribosome biogenesis protein MAK21
VHELAALDDLIALAGKKEHRTAQLALEALKDLLVHNLLPDRQLRKFRTQPLAHPSMAMPSALLFWYEDQLLTRMDRVADALELGLKSTLDFFKKKCMEVAADLLVSKPQHEGRFLAMLVNKLGDPSGAVSTKAIELLRTVVRKQPPMKCVVVREVRQLIHRPNLSVRAVHSGIVFLSQVPSLLRASHPPTRMRNNIRVCSSCVQVPLMPVGDRDVAAQLVEGYMGLFEKAIAEETLGSRLLSTLLSGLDRAFPALGGDVAPVVKHVDALFRIVHSEAFTTSVRALVLISRIALGDADDSNSNNNNNSRGKNGHGKKGKGKRKGEGKGPPAATAQADESEQGITTRFYRALYAKLLSPQVSTRAYNTLFLNLLYRSMKRDPSTRRVMAFVKRLGLCALQVRRSIVAAFCVPRSPLHPRRLPPAPQSSPPVAAGLLFLTAEVCRARPALRAVMQGVDNAEPSSSSSSDPATAAPPRVEDDDDEAAAHSLGNFEASKREPLYAVAEGAVPAAWEASLLAQHYHPSVQTFASSLLSTQRIAFAGDPTKDFSLSAFLNRFAYKNPKKQHAEKIRGSGVDAAGASAGEEPINTSAFLRTSAADVAPDKKFFYKFFGEQEKLRAEGKSKDRSRRKKGSDGDDDDGEGDDEEEEMDAFAQKLAEDMMKDGGDPDMDDFSDDDLDDDDDEEGEDGDVGDDDEDADGDVFRRSEGLGQFHDNEDDDEDDEDDGDEEEEDDEEGDDGYKVTE